MDNVFGTNGILETAQRRFNRILNGETEPVIIIFFSA